MSCEKETYTPRPGPPGVNAGKDKVVILPATETTLTGEAWPHFGISTILSSQWKQVEGPSTANMESPDTSISRVWGLQKGAYLFEQSVQDDFGQSARDTVAVFVIEDTVAGKTYYFDNLTWGLGSDWMQDFHVVQTPSRPDLFFQDNKPMDVFIRYEGSPDWISVPANYGIERSYERSNFSLTITDWRDVNVTKLRNLFVSVRVSFR